MKTTIRQIHLVSDGILVEFDHGVHCYYPTSFLLENVETGANQVFLSYDPSEDFFPLDALTSDAKVVLT